jgi:hypothetical protein
MSRFHKRPQPGLGCYHSPELTGVCTGLWRVRKWASPGESPRRIAPENCPEAGLTLALRTAEPDQKRKRECRSTPWVNHHGVDVALEAHFGGLDALDLFLLQHQHDLGQHDSGHEGHQTLNPVGALQHDFGVHLAKATHIGVRG